MAIAEALCAQGVAVTLIGSGRERALRPYRFMHAASLPRETFEAFPSLPVLKDDCRYEELTFAPGLLFTYAPTHFDVTVTCSYPFTNWVLRRPGLGPRPAHIFVTQNGDWPAFARNAEYRFFGCDGLVCTNPEYYQRNKDRWWSRLIPNGVDTRRFRPGPPERAAYGLPADRPVVLMASAVIASKRVDLAIESVSRLPDAHLAVAGDGPMREEIDAMAAALLPGRFSRFTVLPERMPALYRSADAFLHLAEGESFGNVYIEALASGLAVIAPRSPHLEWIFGEDRYLSAGDRPQALAEALARGLQAPAAEREMRARKADAFSIDSVARQYKSFFEEILAARQAHQRAVAS